MTIRHGLKRNLAQIIGVVAAEGKSKLTLFQIISRLILPPNAISFSTVSSYFLHGLGNLVMSSPQI
jgi:hypothetical protein